MKNAKCLRKDSRIHPSPPPLPSGERIKVRCTGDLFEEAVGY